MLTSYDCIFMLLEVIYTLTVYKIINVVDCIINLYN